MKKFTQFLMMILPLLMFLAVPYFMWKKTEGPLIISIGNNHTRKKIAGKFPVRYNIAKDPAAIIAATVRIGEGTVIMQNAVIQACTQIGKHCIINTAASIDHNCIIEDYVHISPMQPYAAPYI